MIELDKNYNITVDNNNVMLNFKGDPYASKDRKGNPTMVTPSDKWFYPNVKVALKSYVNKSLKTSGSLNEVLSKIESLENQIDNLKVC